MGGVIKVLSRLYVVAGLTIVIFLLIFSGQAFAEFDEWVFEERIHPMSDEDNSWAGVMTANGGMLVLRCTGSNDFYILVGFGDYIGDNFTIVDYRFDDNDVVEAGVWEITPHGSSVFARSELKNDLIAGFFRSDRVVFQTEDHRGLKPYAEFPLAGARSAIRQLDCV